MCTASWLTQGGRLHFFFNRDELTTREPARPPARSERGGVRYLAPADGRAGGTWIAATEGGSVLALLNKSDGERPPEPVSRGGLIPALVSCRAPGELIDACRALGLSRFAPFRLAALWREPSAGVALSWNGERVETVELDPALGLLASSGLGDARASEVRGATWRRRHSSARHWGPRDHRAFHRDHAPRRGAWSVCVHRPEASTVSYTEIELAERELRLRYYEGSPCTAGAPAEVALGLDRSGR